MSIFSRPKGTIVTPFPEWDSGAMAQGGCNTFLTPSAGSNVGLYNNAIQGLRFFIYMLTTSSFNNDDLAMFFISGTLGTLVGPCIAIESGASAPYGEIYVGAAKRPVPPSSVTYGSQSQSIVVGQNWPIAILRPGYSLVIQSDGTGDEMNVSFWYRVGAS